MSPGMRIPPPCATFSVSTAFSVMSSSNVLALLCIRRRDDASDEAQRRPRAAVLLSAFVSFNKGLLRSAVIASTRGGFGREQKDLAEACEREGLFWTSVESYSGIGCTSWVQNKPLMATPRRRPGPPAEHTSNGSLEWAKRRLSHSSKSPSIYMSP